MKDIYIEKIRKLSFYLWKIVQFYKCVRFKYLKLKKFDILVSFLTDLKIFKSEKVRKFVTIFLINLFNFILNRP